jgi:predicted  nucleic acid-binding Zn-ribbon protein
MHSDLLLVYELQKIDLQLQSIERRYTSLDPGRAQAAAEKEARELYEQRTAEHKRVEGELLDAELEQKQVEQKIAEADRKLYSGKVTSPREMMDLQADIEALKRRRASLDETVLTLMDTVEATRAALQQAKERWEAAAAALQDAQQTHKQKVASLSKQAKILVAQRAEAVKPIPEPLLKRYESIRKRLDGIGIGMVQDGQCSACHQQLSHQQIEAVKTKTEPQVCDNCSRLLCMETV